MHVQAAQFSRPIFPSFPVASVMDYFLRNQQHSTFQHYFHITHSHTVQSNSSMHHYKCIALYKDINLQRGQFWASSSGSFRSREERSPWMVFIQVVFGHPGGRLQLSGGGSEMTWHFKCIIKLLSINITVQSCILVIHTESDLQPTMQAKLSF